MIVLDDFLDKDLYLKMLEDSSFYPESMGGGDQIATELNSYHYEQASCYAPYMFWDGWWRSPANTLKKQIIQNIWGSRLAYQHDDILGFEYWTRTYTAGQYLQTHVDEDTFLYSRDKIFTGPINGAIFYGCNNIDGGFLEIHKNVLLDGTSQALEKEISINLLSDIEDRERIAYKGNRLIIFDAGHVMHNTTPAQSGIRQVMIINVWHKDNPPLALSLNEFYYE